jgi:hypothetical protein
MGFFLFLFSFSPHGSLIANCADFMSLPVRAYCAMTNLQEAVLPSLSMTFAM